MENNELETLRQQVAEFKSRLDKQEIVSDRMLREAMLSRTKWMIDANRFSLPLSLLVIGLMIYYYYSMHLMPLWILILFIVIFLIEIASNLLNAQLIRPEIIATQNLVKVRRELTKFRRREKLYLMINLPLMALIFILWAWQRPDLFQAWVAILIGFLIGTLIGFFIFWREMRSINETLRQIDEYENSL